jgi:ABC-2 type transport system permease protein
MSAIMKKEMRGYFNSWIGYVFLFILVALVAVFFALINLYSMSANFQDALGNIPIFCLILVPVLTMRIFAEEARQKTDQLLYTSPVTVPSIVMAKFLSAFILALIGLAITGLFAVMIMPYGKLPGPQIMTSYLGYALLFAAFISVGMFISACTDNQIIAAVVSFFVLMFLYIMDGIASYISNIVTSTSTGSSSGLVSLVFVAVVIAVLAYIIYDSTKNFYVSLSVAVILLAAAIVVYIVKSSAFDGLLVKVVNWFSIMTRFDNFSNGILSISDIIYYISFTGAFIYLTINTIEKRRWK